MSELPCCGTEAVAFSRDGKLLASVRNRGELRLWDTATGKLLAKVDHSSGINGFVNHRGMAFSPDGKTLAVGVANGIGTTGRIFLWDVRNGRLKLRTTLKEHTKGVLALAFTPKGNTLLSAGHDKNVRIWDAATGKTRSVLREHRERILGMALSADGRLLVTGDPGEVKVWDLKAEKETASWKVVDLVDLALSPDGKLLAVSSFPKGGIVFRDVVSGGRRTDLRPLPDATSPMAFSPDGRRFVSVNRDRTRPATVRVTDVATGRPLATYSHRGHHVQVVAWSSDGRLLASGDYNERASAQLLLRDVLDLPPRPHLP